MTTYSKTIHNEDFSQCLPNCEITVINPSRRLTKTFKFWIERSRQRKQLAKLDSRMLKDIGITRAEANAELAKPFWR